MTRLHRPARLGMTLVVVGVLLGCASCGHRKVRVRPVEGKVLFKGEPAAGAYVFFRLDEDDDRLQPGCHPSAITGIDGAFRLTTYKPGDGAPPGTYKVTIYWEKSTGVSDDAIPVPGLARYSSPETTPIEATVIEGASTVLEPFNLTPE